MLTYECATLTELYRIYEDIWYWVRKYIGHIARRTEEQTETRAVYRIVLYTVICVDIEKFCQIKVSLTQTTERHIP